MADITVALLDESTQCEFEVGVGIDSIHHDFVEKRKQVIIDFSVTYVEAIGDAKEMVNTGKGAEEMNNLMQNIIMKNDHLVDQISKNINEPMGLHTLQASFESIRSSDYPFKIEELYSSKEKYVERLLVGADADDFTNNPNMETYISQTVSNYCKQQNIKHTNLGVKGDSLKLS